MPFEEAIPTLRFDRDGDGARAQIAAAAEKISGRSRENPRLRVIAAGDSLSTETISALITALRKFRELGGAIELLGESEAVRATIVLNGLDRVFAFPLVPDDEPSRSRQTPRKRRGIDRAA